MNMPPMDVPFKYTETGTMPAPESLTGPEFLRFCIHALGGVLPPTETSYDDLKKMMLYEIERNLAQLIDKPEVPPYDVQALHTEVAQLRGQLVRAAQLAHQLVDLALNTR